MSCRHLDRLEDQEILRRLEALVRRERATTVEVLLHLGQVDRRKLHLSLGYGSLFEYATRHLRYSSSGAGRRIQAARAVQRYPQALRSLRQNEVNLTTLAIVSGILTPENADALLKEIRHKTQREVETLVAQFHPASAIRDIVRPVFVHKQTSLAASGVAASGTNPELVHSQTGSSKLLGAADRDAVAGRDAVAERDAGGVVAGDTNEQRFLLRFAASPEFMAKLEQARALLSNRYRGAVPLEAVFETALDQFLERHSPMHRKARRENRTRRSRKKSLHTQQDREPGSTAPGGEKPVGEVTGDQVMARSRHVPAAVRDEVFARDEGRCTYVGPDGTGCGAKFRIEIDHILPFGLSGPTVASNLRLLCAAHNALEAERVYGIQHMLASREKTAATPRLGVEKINTSGH